MKYEPADIFFIAGEASGDLQASLLSGALQAVRPHTGVAGVGGDALAATGARIAYHTPELASIGPISVIPLLPLLYTLYFWLDHNLKRHPPRLLMPVDAGGFNVPLIRRLRRGGYSGRILYYIPPGAWVDNPRQARAVAANALALTPFQHQRDFYRGLGLQVEYFGHPLVSVIAARPQPEQTAAPHIALLPGSRREEVARHLPILARAAAEIERRSAARFSIVASSATRSRQIAEVWRRSGGPQAAAIVRAKTTQALQAVTLAWVASGTAVLEAALLAVPQIAFYAISPSQYQLARRKVPEHLLHTITLPNLVLRRRIVPELLQHDFTAQRLIDESTKLLSDERQVQRQLEGYGELRNSLGPPDSLQRIAAFVAGYMDAASP